MFFWYEIQDIDFIFNICAKTLIPYKMKQRKYFLYQLLKVLTSLRHQFNFEQSNVSVNIFTQSSTHILSRHNT